MKIKKHNNGLYYAHFRSERGPQELNLKTRNLGEAKQLAKDAKIEALEYAAKIRALTAETVVRITSGGKLTCREAMQQWSEWTNTVGLTPGTRARYETYISSFLDRTKLWDRPPTELTVKRLDAFVNPTDEDIKGTTRSNRLNSLQSFFLVLTSRGYVIGDPSREVRVKFHQLTFEQKEPERHKPFSADELVKLRKLNDPFWKVAAVLGETFGLRISDVAQLEWASFAKRGKIIVWTDKHDRRVEFDLPKDVELAIANVDKTDARYVFPEQAATARNTKLRSKLSTYFARVLQREGIEGKSFHSFRHTFATEHKKLGESIDEIRLKLGHALPSTTAGYIHAP